MTLTPDGAGASSTVIARNFLVGVTPGSALVHHLAWTNAMIKQWSANAGSPGQKLYFTVGDLAPNVSYAVHKGGSTLLTLNSGETGRIAFSDVAGSTNGVHYSVEPDLQTFVQRGPNGFVISWTGGWLQRATTLSPPNWQNVPMTNGQFSVRINPFEPMEFFRTGVGP